MSHCVFIAADDPLPEVTPSGEYPLQIDLDTGTISDGGADDNYCLFSFDEVDLYCSFTDMWSIVIFPIVR